MVNVSVCQMLGLFGVYRIRIQRPSSCPKKLKILPIGRAAGPFIF